MNSHAKTKATSFLAGPLGLNTVPSARMDETGTVRASISTLDPYVHGTIGAQIIEPLYLSLRQTAEISNINGSADRLYPGLDMKLRLLKEDTYWPEISLGMQSIIGHKRMAGEYLAFSKRYKNFDFTGGIAWGRLGSAAHISNPLKSISSHFGKNRALDGENPNDVNDWFTGEDVGFFGGIEYYTPLEGLSIKADWGADRFIAEQTAFDYDPPAPWSIGASYSPKDWITGQIALVGGEKLMGTLTVQNPFTNWPGRTHKQDEITALRPYRTGMSLPQQMELSANKDDVGLFDVRRNEKAAWGKLNVTHDMPLPQQLGRAARHMANHAGENVEKLMITPVMYGIRGPSVSLMRRDLEQALIHDQGSPQEIWRNAVLNEDIPADLKQGVELNLHKNGPYGLPWKWRVIQDNQISLSEEDSGILYRNGLVVETREQTGKHLLYGAAVRLDVTDNLERLREFRPRSPLPVRSNIDEFAQRTVSVDRTYLSYLTAPRTDLYVAATAGYLEEMYGGLGGEILYRPFGKTFAVGAESFLAFKRDPFQSFNLGFNGDRLLTGHIHAFYEMPGTDLTFKGSVGRYLAEDIGGTFSLHKRFENGVQLKGFVTATDQADFDVFGSTTHLYSGLQISLPIGNIPYVPRSSEIRTTFAPLGRDTGQALDKPIDLYEFTEPISYRHIGQYWHRLLR